MKDYKHLSLWERGKIARRRASETPIRVIARALGRAISTISRELKRNSNKDFSYNPVSSERRYLARRQRLSILSKDKKLATFVIERLHENWTPEQISGWLAHGNERGLRTIAHETIYHL